MEINRGSGPNDNQGQIWATNMYNKLVENHAYVAANNTYGQNWLPVNSWLTAGDYLSSTNGKLVLMMQADGNLTLSTFANAVNCQSMSDGNTGGGFQANALYNLNNVGYPANMGLLAYIDQNTGLTAYPESNTQYSTNYTAFDSLNSLGNDILNASYSNATVDQCQSTCNSNAECAGFVLSSSTLGSTCYPKTSGMYPSSPGQSDPNYTTYVRTLEPINPAPGISTTVNNITSSTYQNYPSSVNNTNYTLQNVTAAQQQQLSTLQTRLDTLANQLNNYTSKFS
jgi:hypothetical protein